MRLVWTKTAWADYSYWQKNDKKKLKRINELIKATMREPFDGLGKPEALKHDLQAYWFRRIDTEHRLVYLFKNEELVGIACWY